MNGVRTRVFPVIGIAATVAMIAVAWRAPRLAAAGWLIAFVYVSAFPLGSLALLMIHRLTGGRWGDNLAPILLPAAMSTPLLLILFLLLLPALTLIFPWAHAPPDVAAIYLNAPSFIVRSLVALGGLSALAILLPRLRGGLLPAGLGLVFYAVIISLVPRDWFLSTEPPFASTSFGAGVAVTNMMAALALVAVLMPRAERNAVSDLGGLLLALTLAITYIDFMAVLVIWYGDLPHKVFWFVERIEAPWRAFAIAAFVLASLVPVVLLLFERVRTSRHLLRFVGALILAGLALCDIWLLAPVFGPASIATAALALTAMGSLFGTYVVAGWHEIFAHSWRSADGH